MAEDSGNNTSHKHLAGTSDVKETCFIGKREGKTHQNQLGGHTQSISYSSYVGKGSEQQAFKTLDRILSNHENQNGTGKNT